jgi:hypothetical protein
LKTSSDEQSNQKSSNYRHRLQTYRIPGTGILSYLPGGSFHPGGGYEPWNAVVTDHFGRFVYTSSWEELNPANAIFSIYRVGSNGLALASSYPAGFASDSIVVDFTGQFFYAGENDVKGTHGPVEGTALAVYRITGTGSLTPVSGTPYQLGFSPDAIATSP